MTILCATRGGEASIRTQEHVIDMAKEQNTDIVFLYVADVTFLNSRMTATDVMTSEMEKMGEFLLLMAKERAEKREVKAETVVKNGEFRAALVEAAQEAEADMIVLGSPAEESITRHEYLEELAHSITEESGIETRIV